MKYQELDLYPSRFVDNYDDGEKYLAKWREDVYGPLSILFAMRELMNDEVKTISFAVGGHPKDEDMGEIKEIVTIGKAPQKANYVHPYRYCGTDKDPIGAGSYAVPSYSEDPLESAMMILSNMAKGNIYRIK